MSWPVLQPLLAGMIAGVAATLVVQPIDFIKLRQQLSGEGVKSAARPSAISLTVEIVRTGGIGVLYTGISAALARQVIYGSSRLGLFRLLSDWLKATVTGGHVLPVSLKIGAALVAGAVAALLGNPCDLALVRMQADSSLPLEQRRYSGILDALWSVARDEGALSLWRGSTPTVLRAMAVNAGMLATADQAKESLALMLGDSPAREKATGTGTGRNALVVLLLSSFVAGITASAVSLPFDAIKTRGCQVIESAASAIVFQFLAREHHHGSIMELRHVHWHVSSHAGLQKQKPLPDGSMPYKGFRDCVKQILKKEGPLAFYKVSDSVGGVYWEIHETYLCAPPPPHPSLTHAQIIPVLGQLQGFGTYAMRLGPHTFIALIVQDWAHARLDAWANPAAAEAAITSASSSTADSRDQGWVGPSWILEAAVAAVLLFALAVALICCIRAWVQRGRLHKERRRGSSSTTGAGYEGAAALSAPPEPGINASDQATS
jgi:solute carrier family 25 (mitochondrial oxoglutarate transporter), member 11